jgi:hypothetical protein
MFRQVLLALTMCAVVGISAHADTIVVGSHQSPYGPLYSASSVPFEAFEWTPLDFAAFSAYGGDFANVRRPVVPVTFFEDPMLPGNAPGPEDEQANMRLRSLPFFEELPSGMPQQFNIEELPVDVSEAAQSIPEPEALMLVGLGLLSVSRRLRRTFHAR